MVMPSIEKVLLYNPISKDEAIAFESKIVERLNNEFLSHYSDPAKVAELKKKFDVQFEVLRTQKKQQLSQILLLQ